MSYCVHCGVELAESEKYCPLCHTEVVNPRSPWKEPGVRPYPSRLELIMRRLNRYFSAQLISLFLSIPVLITLLCDFLDHTGLSWSLYVLGAYLLLMVWIIPPLCAKRYRKITFIGLDCLALTLYLLGICIISGGNWFLGLAFPIMLTISLMILGDIYLFHRKRFRFLLVRIALILTDVAILAMIIEATVDWYVRGQVNFNWAPYVLISCLILAGVAQVIQRQEKLKEEIVKRLFY